MIESKFKELKKLGAVSPKTTLKEFKDIMKATSSSRIKSKKRWYDEPWFKSIYC